MNKYLSILLLSLISTFSAAPNNPIQIIPGFSGGGTGGGIAGTVTAIPGGTVNFVPIFDSTGTNLVNSSLSASSVTNISNSGVVSADSFIATNGIKFPGLTLGAFVKVDSTTGYLTNVTRLQTVGTTNIALTGTMTSDSQVITNFTQILNASANAILQTDGSKFITNSVLTVSSVTNITSTGPITVFNLHSDSSSALTANDPFTIRQGWNNGAVVFTGILFNATNITSSASSLLMDLQVGGVSQMNVSRSGVTTTTGSLTTGGLISSGSSVSVTATSPYLISTRGRISCPSDGIILLQNNAVNDFSRLQFGLTTSAAPSLKRNGAGLDVRLADDSAYALIVSGGTTAAGNAVAGTLGEVVSSLIASASPVSLTTATAANVTSISLTAGDWDVDGNINFSASSATVTGTSGGITVTTATVPVDGSEVYSGVQVTLLSENDSVTIPSKRVNVNATTTVYLVGKSTFSAGTVSAFGSIRARRVR